MGYKRWITNCPGDQSFERLMKHSAGDPDGFYTIGPPRETITMCQNIFLQYGFHSSGSYNVSKGCTAEELEHMDYCGIYECFPPTSC